LISTIYVTTGTEAEAEQISTRLVEQHLIACANYFPIKSIYYWEGELQKDQEYALIMKTQTSKVDEVIRMIKELHSYDVPCIESYPVGKGHPEFLDWVMAESTQ
jgi:periplasmic divalent cation tolerance protein